MKFNMLIVAMLCLVLFVVPIFKGGAFNTSPSAENTSYSREASKPVSQDTPQTATPMLKPIDNQDVTEPNINKSSVWNNSNKANVSLTFKILNESTGKIDKVTYKDFVKGAICAEMPPDFQLEAMKSQGICALTYALYNQKMHGNSNSPASSEYDFSADPENWKVYVTKDIAKKRYGDKFEQYWTKISEAANAIDNIVMVYENEPILAAYHSTSSGYTEDAQNVWQKSLPYLVPVESEGDLLAPQYKTEVSFSTDELKKKLENSLKGLKLSDNPSEWFEVLSRSDGGYITGIQIGNQKIHGKQLRSILDLRSSDFDISYINSQFTFIVYGYGHGIGMSQYGAEHMALQGSNCEDILSHYFSDISFVSIDDVLS